MTRKDMAIANDSLKKVTLLPENIKKNIKTVTNERNKTPIL